MTNRRRRKTFPGILCTPNPAQAGFNQHLNRTGAISSAEPSRSHQACQRPSVNPDMLGRLRENTVQAAPHFHNVAFLRQQPGAANGGEVALLWTYIYGRASAFADDADFVIFHRQSLPEKRGQPHSDASSLSPPRSSRITNFFRANGFVPDSQGPPPASHTDVRSSGIHHYRRERPISPAFKPFHHLPKLPFFNCCCAAAAVE